MVSDLHHAKGGVGKQACNPQNVCGRLRQLTGVECGDFDSPNVEIAQVGEDAAAGAKTLWGEIRAEWEGKGRSTSVTVARREIRKWLSESSEGQRVEGLVSRVLGE